MVTQVPPVILRIGRYRTHFFSKRFLYFVSLFVLAHTESLLDQGTHLTKHLGIHFIFPLPQFL